MGLVEVRSSLCIQVFFVLAVWGVWLRAVEQNCSSFFVGALYSSLIAIVHFLLSCAMILAVISKAILRERRCASWISTLVGQEGVWS